MIPHNRLTIEKEEIEAADRVLLSGFLAQGKEVEAFENELCHYLGYDEGHAVAVSSGSAALYMALRAISYKKDVSTVAIPAYSCTALKNAVILAKKQPVYADVGTETPNIDLDENNVTNSDAVIACHMFGTPQKIENANIIEDCAQAIGATINGNKAGTQTCVSVFSFYATKLITSGGEGGMVASKDRDIIDHIRDLRDFDMKNDNLERFNFQMTDLQAAIGRAQLKKLDSFIDRRRYLAYRYQDKGVSLWNFPEKGNAYRALIKTESPNELIDYLSANNIKAIIPIESGELLCNGEDVPRALELTKGLVSIPIYPSLTEDEQDMIIQAICKYKDREVVL